jgi:hypothetical protein
MHTQPVFHSAERLLEAAADGRIPPAARARAKAIDAARPRTIGFLKVGRITMKPRTVIDLMASAILNGWQRDGTVTEADFTRLGLTHTQIAEHKAAAWSEALRQDPRIISMCDEDCRQ